ncbi:MAG: J domain-containing protein [Deltaproteobacteria bacterium]|jgi:curved DNA-binding protein CbpA|nr:J domain-containing protein [Deltaproteobacteria bacterium]MBW2571171.1 J domain-containing protein [Deltaproteobacteria bacterium]MBW2712019.1 J domain-containing protein [Deltaproteobacteria bacterium]NOQ19967.1 DnaJ domain-containing protein [Desulfobacterales bacterium]
MGIKAFTDCYENLQISPNADMEMIERVFRLLAKRYHPDNKQTGNAEKFNTLNDAYRMLSDPEKRAAYDVKYDQQRAASWKIFEEASHSDGFDEDNRIRQGVLSLLYTARRRDASNPGMGIMELEKFLSCPQEHMEFHVWYLKEKNWIRRTESGEWSITADGVDKAVEGDRFLRKDRLLPEPEGFSTESRSPEDSNPDSKTLLNDDSGQQSV